MEMGFPRSLQAPAPAAPVLVVDVDNSDDDDDADGLTEWGAVVIDAYMKRFRCYPAITPSAIKWAVLQQAVPEKSVGPAPLEHGFVVLPLVPPASSRHDPYSQACVAHVVRQLSLSSGVGHFVRPVLSRTWARSSEGRFIDLGVKLPCGLGLHGYKASDGCFWTIFLDRLEGSWNLLRAIERGLDQNDNDHTIQLDNDVVVCIRLMTHPYGGAKVWFGDDVLDEKLVIVAPTGIPELRLKIASVAGLVSESLESESLERRESNPHTIVGQRLENEQATTPSLDLAREECLDFDSLGQELGSWMARRMGDRTDIEAARE